MKWVFRLISALVRAIVTSVVNERYRWMSFPLIVSIVVEDHLILQLHLLHAYANVSLYSVYSFPRLRRALYTPEALRCHGNSRPKHPTEEGILAKCSSYINSVSRIFPIED